MQPNELFEQFSRQLNNNLGPGARAIGDELQQHIRTAMNTAIGKLDLVSREEFDAQQAVLQRTRQRLEELEKQVAELESQLK
ncbi:accessory factor UbiK family protein [Porticoccus sp. W117]|uniref:accessory factor UbiK family protein n=1 Tax=Porticoccus sp. W117 TaxID=3054777 RepID=UPI00259829B0|nr:accessory factor UbiK family protein [Porticoccus sp. W117]MDM3872182.1 accessory factor UbiK family protein [Porticoccus sp. W117]